MSSRTHAAASARRSETWLRIRGLSNLTRMGHCAPTVLRTVLEASGTASPRLVKLAAGLPGGIGNTGEECGGITAPLMAIGLQHADDPLEDGIPPVVWMGHDLVGRFAASHGTLRCCEIRNPTGVPLRCIGVVMRSAGRCQAVDGADCTGAITGEHREAIRRMQAHLTEAGFHCAHAVLDQLRDCVPVDDDLVAASAAFVGGTVFTGRTCSALTAGVMALGAARGELEDSRPRVARMIALMAVAGDAFADGVNAFNKLMNMGNRLARWFLGRFGTTRCAELTGCDFGTLTGVHRYAEGDVVSRCRDLARGVAAEVRHVLAGDAAEGR